MLRFCRSHLAIPQHPSQADRLHPSKSYPTIARQLLSPKLNVEPQSITLKTQVRTPAEFLALSNMITFTPGTLTLEITRPAR